MRALRESRSGRTNQFDIYTRLEGLQEKFRVLNNEELADALAVRLEELSRASLKWAPEVLSLFLELSDQPAEKSDVKNLERMKRPEPPLPALTWTDILADDPLDNNGGLWDTVDFAADSSDEGSDISPDFSSISEGTDELTGQGDTENLNIDALILRCDESELQEVTKAQFWTGEENLHEVLLEHGTVQSKYQITEKQLLREVIFMLLGLPTSVYTRDMDGYFSTNRQYSIQHAQEISIGHVLDSYATIGNGLVTLRNWTAETPETPLEQAIQAAFEKRLFALDRALTAMQADMLTPSTLWSGTLLGQMPKVQDAVRLALQVSDIITQLRPVHERQMILEFLHDRTGLNQDIGDFQGYEYMARLFFECFNPYLKSIALWMEEGELSEPCGVFFIRRNQGELALSSLWQKQNTLLHNSDGILDVPNFIRFAVNKIYTAGKSVIFLRQLGNCFDEDSLQRLDDCSVDYEAVCQTSENDNLSPFSERFIKALDRWVAGKHHASTSLLRDRLETRCGLWRTLDAIEHIYFSRNGAVTTTVTNRIFERIDQGKESWNDRFLLTELFQGVFGELPCIDAERLSIRLTSETSQDMQNPRRSAKILNCLKVNYALPWPIANIMRHELLGVNQFTVHQRIFVFLAQVYRAKYVLERGRLLKSPLSPLGSEEAEKSLVYSLRHRLLWFTNILNSYLTETVLSVTTSAVRINLADAEDVDAMISTYDAYVMHLEDQCLVSEKLAPIYQAIISLLDLSILFSDCHASYTGEKPFDVTNRSTMTNTSQLRSLHPRRRKASDASSSEDDHEENNSAAEVDYISFTEVAYVDRLRKMHDSFTNLSGFVTAGLRGVSRAGGEPCWESLAENLASGTSKINMV